MASVAVFPTSFPNIAVAAFIQASSFSVFSHVIHLSSCFSEGRQRYSIANVRRQSSSSTTFRFIAIWMSMLIPYICQYPIGDALSGPTTNQYRYSDPLS